MWPLGPIKEELPEAPPSMTGVDVFEIMHKPSIHALRPIQRAFVGLQRDQGDREFLFESESAYAFEEVGFAGAVLTNEHTEVAPWVAQPASDLRFFVIATEGKTRDLVRRNDAKPKRLDETPRREAVFVYDHWLP